MHIINVSLYLFVCEAKIKKIKKNLENRFLFILNYICYNATLHIDIDNRYIISIYMCYVVPHKPLTQYFNKNKLNK